MHSQERSKDVEAQLVMLDCGALDPLCAVWHPAGDSVIVMGKEVDHTSRRVHCALDGGSVSGTIDQLSPELAPNTLVFSPDGRFAAWAQVRHHPTDGATRFCEIYLHEMGGETTRIFAARNFWLEAAMGSLVFRGDGQCLAWGELGERAIMLYDIPSKVLRTIHAVMPNPSLWETGAFLAFSPCGRYLVQGTGFDNGDLPADPNQCFMRGAVYQFDLRSSAAGPQLIGLLTHRVEHLVYDPRGVFILAGSYVGAVTHYAHPPQSLVALKANHFRDVAFSMPIFREGWAKVWRVACHPTKTWVAIGTSFGEVAVWNYTPRADGCPPTPLIFSVGTYSVTSLSFSPNGDHLLCASHLYGSGAYSPFGSPVCVLAMASFME